MAARGFPITSPPEAEKEQVAELYRMLLHDETPALLGPGGEKRDLPHSVYEVLMKILASMQEDRPIAILPLMDELTTKSAAVMLGVSRQYLVRLLENDKIPFHRTGTHRRIYLKDILDYKNKRDELRREGLKTMAQEAVDAGVYDKYIPLEE
jgi:excisionase family DNA binding protein